MFYIHIYIYMYMELLFLNINIKYIYVCVQKTVHKADLDRGKTAKKMCRVNGQKFFLSHSIQARQTQSVVKGLEKSPECHSALFYEIMLCSSGKLLLLLLSSAVTADQQLAVASHLLHNSSLASFISNSAAQSGRNPTV